ncbi:MAG: hypothetical protein D6808_01370 [Candidatus Dadabacteria bacterium]|nr:MAG: hypothetical protein D6808_01370 [Candidatus Dadabacteria bacterium]
MTTEDKWEEMRKAKEEMYFKKKNEEAVKRFREKQKGDSLLSPVTGSIMEVTEFKGVTVRRCPDTGGIWLEKGQLEEIIKNVLEEKKEKAEDWLGDLFSFVAPSE